MKKLLLLCSLIFIGYSPISHAEVNLRDEMMVMAQRLVFANKSTTTEDFRNNIEIFINAAEKSKETLPPKWEGDTSQFPGYQQGLQKVIDIAKEADNLAIQNKLNEAKEKLNAMPELRKMYHKLYK
ncbi:cytochrome b562 [Rodentibacter haemolyticus]|uniref:Cytochrome B562 n=1 Tax=Rodentibacter haemolyticus TaxID=2778911 RepID=A0ABX6UZV4_9PAST|nr:cytochrome b562 [Rodentibacter haemolyticus]QPB43309.1 cytochrome B562 [Rodentibacter haemolyticus]